MKEKLKRILIFWAWGLDHVIKVTRMIVGEKKALSSRLLEILNLGEAMGFRFVYFEVISTIHERKTTYKKCYFIAYAL